MDGTSQIPLRNTPPWKKGQTLTCESHLGTKQHRNEGHLGTRTIFHFKQLKILTFLVKYEYIPMAVSHHVPGIL